MHHTVNRSSWFAIAVALYCLVSFNPLSANQITHSQSSTHQASSNWDSEGAADSPVGSGILQLRGNGINTDAVLMNTEIELDVNGLLADMVLSQQFTNTSDEWLEGVYMFPLPIDAAVHAMTIQVGNRTIVGEIKTKENAKKTYKEAKESGQVATLVEQQRPNMFTARVANIEPGALISVRLEIMLPVHFENAQFNLLLPTTYTPRYTNVDTPDATDITGPVAHSDDIAGPALTLNARIEPIESIFAVNSTTHKIEYNGTAVTLFDSPMDRDLVLSWPASSAQAVLGSVFTTDFSGERYMQLMLPPPSDTTNIQKSNRELILILDKSGSMAGDPIRAAKRAVLSALDGLDTNDHFNIIAFDNNATSLFSTALIADATNIAKATRFIRKLSADGGTEMHEALNFALKSEDPDRLRQLVFVTDGSVGYEDELLKIINRNISNNRLFTVGIGSAPNRFFLEKAAEVGRGTSLSIMNIAQVQEKMDTLLQKLEHPVLTQFELTFEGGDGEFYPNPLPDLYQDQPLMLVAKIDEAVTGINLQASQAGELWQQSLPIPASADSTVSSIARHWAQKKITNLADEQRISDKPEKNKAEITNTALAFSLVSQYTSFIGVEQEPARPAADDLSVAHVANLMPAGAAMQSVLIPMGSAASDTLAALCVLFGAMGILMWWAAWKLGAMSIQPGRAA